MTPAPSSSRNRRSATLSNIPLPIGPLPPPPQHGLSQHSPHSSFSSHSGPLSVTIPGHQPSVYPGGSSPYGPPRASFSSSRASPSPVTQTRSGREREQEARSDNAWRSIFDAALVKAQQAVQLDELQETALAANLYAQAANDLGRVIPMCSSEKKKQSMLAIQAIYLDRVSQLKESTAKASSKSDSAATGESHDGANNYRYSVASNQGMAYGDETQQQYQPQQFQTQSHMQQQLYQPHPAQQLQQQYQTPAPIPVQHLPHQLHHIQHTQQQPLVLQQQQPIQQQTPQEQQGKGFRFFGKKRSKTQPSATHPPEFNQTWHTQDPSNSTGYSQYGEHVGSENDGYSVPYMAPPRAPSPPPVVVSPIFMTQPPNSTHESGQSEEQKTNKSSKWRPFGKKKSKSFSNNETSTAYNPQQEIIQTPPMPTPAISTPVFSPTLEPVAAPHLVDPTDYSDAYSHQKQSDWYVANTQEEYGYNEFEFENQNRYYDDGDEEVDPYYIADTKGRAQAFEGENAGSKDTQPKELEEKDTSLVRKPLNHSASSYSQEQSFTPNYMYAQNDSATSPTAQADQHLQSGPMLDEHAYTQAYMVDESDGNITEDLAQQHYLKYQEQQYYQQHQQDQQHQQYFGDDDAIVPDVRGVDEAPALATPESAAGPESDLTAHPENKDETALEKSKSKRTWFGKKKKDKAKEPERFDDVAKLMDEALFGSGSAIKAQKDKQKGKEREKENGEEYEREEEMKKMMMEMEMEENVPSSAQPDNQQSQDIESPLQAHADISDKPAVEVAVEGATEAAPIDVTPDAAEDYFTTTKETSSEHDGRVDTFLAPVPESSELVTSESGITTTTGQDAKSIVSDTPKRSKTRHFGIFRSKKNKDVETFQEGTALTPVATNDDEKSMHSSHTRQSSQSADRRATELAVALTVRPKEKETKARVSDEYVPYEYQEELEGPLMERVEVPENREVIGFVMPIEEAMDYTLEGNEEAALENWDSWVSQLESFEKVLSDKGMKKEKIKKVKKAKEPKDEALAPMGSIKANRSSIFGLGQSDILRSRASTTLDLNAHLQEGRPLSMSTTLLDDGSSSNPRLSFQSSKSGGSEIPVQFITTQQAKKRWWNPKRKETVSLYRVSNAFSMADLDQDRHLSTLLRSEDRIHSSDNLTLDTTIMSMPLTLTEPSTPAPEFTKDAPASMKSTLELDMMDDNKDDNKDKEKSAPKEDEEAESEVAIAPMPKTKAKAKSNKPKLLPISTPLSQLLKIENAEELWQYVQQAKTYATSRMNKGDKRSASIALKRAQALESRWQEVLLEMASSDEDTDGLLEDEDEEEESEEEVAVMPVKKEKAAPKEDVAPVVVTPTLTPIMNPLNTHNAIEDDDEEEDYVVHRRNTISRSNSTPDKYSKYKVNKPAPVVSATSSPSLAILTEEETNEKGELSVKNSAATLAAADNHDDGRLGSDATLEQMTESTSVEHLKFYIQRMKTDTVAKARNGSKFAALEGMKNVKVLQQRLADLQESNEEGEEDKEKTVQDTEIKEKDA
ncbi:hypothetical protein BG011_000510 [Mortierella polycephala]|uniref:MIT domain-containing protein n=1 Tax=Mortierella polycephala TaxID=41804 RepID=A0A9P6U5Y0_9FUNG|nr:hypothetical protein BG011_000510 [Mortierella polycephala]